MISPRNSKKNSNFQKKLTTILLGLSNLVCSHIVLCFFNFSQILGLNSTAGVSCAEAKSLVKHVRKKDGNTPVLAKHHQGTSRLSAGVTFERRDFIKFILSLEYTHSKTLHFQVLHIDLYQGPKVRVSQQLQHRFCQFIFNLSLMTPLTF